MSYLPRSWRGDVDVRRVNTQSSYQTGGVRAAAILEKYGAQFQPTCLTIFHLMAYCPKDMNRTLTLTQQGACTKFLVFVWYSGVVFNDWEFESTSDTR